MPVRAIFIGYRRDDSEGQARRLYNDLIRQFGEGSVFMDVATIDPGLDFRKVIDKSVSSCGVLLALIGPAWQDARRRRAAATSSAKPLLTNNRQVLHAWQPQLWDPIAPATP